MEFSSDEKLIDEKKRKRLERNRESARECRKRKKDKATNLKQQITHLEADNLQLRLQLQIGPESIQQEDEKALEITSNIENMIKQGASENEIKNAIAVLQEKFSDYGRDRRSAIDFHIKQLHRCIQTTQTTKAILWLLSCALNFYDSGGNFIDNINDKDLTKLWNGLHNVINPTKEQCQRLVNLASTPLDVHRSNDISSVSVSNETVNLDAFTANDNEELLHRLDQLVSYKNSTLDQEMSEIQSIFSASQIARFIVWIKENPVVMQMLECIWPHVAKSEQLQGIENNL